VGGCAVNNCRSLLVVLVLAALSGCHPDGTSSLSSPQQVSSKETVGNATLSWEAPTTTTNGSALTDLAGYRIYYGLDEKDLSETVDLATVGMQTYVIDNLASGTWYFAIKAVTSAGVESALSNVVSKTIG
jgi:hypothetical protein